MYLDVLTMWMSTLSLCRVLYLNNSQSLNTLLMIMELHLLQDLKNGEVVYCNLMSIFMLGVKSVLEQRKSQLYGPILEEAISLSFQIVILAFLKESLFVEAWYPSHQARASNSLSWRLCLVGARWSMQFLLAVWDVLVSLSSLSFKVDFVR